MCVCVCVCVCVISAILFSISVLIFLDNYSRENKRAERTKFGEKTVSISFCKELTNSFEVSVFSHVVNH